MRAPSRQQQPDDAPSSLGERIAVRERVLAFVDEWLAVCAVMTCKCV
jgi:hypothetical protein